MKQIKKEDLIGKTIRNIDDSSMDAWHIYFTDDTAVTISGENGVYGIPALSVDELWGKFDSARQD
jgi:hypothetical protein